MRLKATMLLVLFATFIFSSIDASAQNRTVEGTVTSTEDGEPLPGVTVLVKGTNRGTTTNTEGE